MNEYLSLGLSYLFQEHQLSNFNINNTQVLFDQSSVIDIFNFNIRSVPRIDKYSKIKCILGRYLYFALFIFTSIQLKRNDKKRNKK
jgi:hypothetical protein